MKIHYLFVASIFAFIAVIQPARADNSPIRVACVGDSITEGAMSDNPYPAQLQKLLGTGYDVKNFGLGGRTLLKEGDMPYWKEKAYADAKAFAPNFVVIMLGTNDTKDQNWKFKDKFAAEYKEFVESFKTLNSKPTIFVCRPPPAFGVGNYGINEPNLQVVISMVDQVAKDEGATVLDMHAALETHPETEGDRIHPNAAGDAIIAKVVADAVKTPAAAQ